VRLASAGFGKIASVCFGATPGDAKSSGDLLLQSLLEQLRTRFETVSTPMKSWFSPLRFVRLHLEENLSLQLAFGRNRHKDGEWVLLVGPLQRPSMRAFIRGQKVVQQSAEVLRICREVHAFLAVSSGISAIRWYFQTPRHVMKTAVATPDELPWDQA
jgi:hypothetical protein